jgi:CheY-like chemotaxis protein
MARTEMSIILRTIALADDDSDDADLFAEALMEIDPEIRFKKATNGRELLEKMQIEEVDFPDIIFLDINMPEMNGWECLSELKKDRRLRNVPVVIYSTSSNVNDKKMAIKLGASYFYTKPDNYQQLKKFLEGLINNPYSVINN